MSRLTQLDHTGVLVSDFERSKNFYIDFLGMELRKDSSGLDPAVGTPNVQVRSGEAVLFLFRNLKPGESKEIRPGPAPHIELSVSDPEAALRYLSESEYPFEGPIETPSGEPLFYFNDPDRNLFSFSLRGAEKQDLRGIGVTGFGQINLPVTDMERATDFYTEVMGLEVRADHLSLNPEDARQEFRPHRVLGGKNTTLALFPVWNEGDYERICRDGRPLDRSPRSRTRVLHLAFRSEDREALLEKFDELGYPYEVYEGRGSRGYEVYVHDTSGFRLEIVG
jgi:catechol 2,3-dioxygenase-like lactoylglutathione lyase family enzyme